MRLLALLKLMLTVTIYNSRNSMRLLAEDYDGETMATSTIVEIQ